MIEAALPHVAVLALQRNCAGDRGRSGGDGRIERVDQAVEGRGTRMNRESNIAGEHDPTL